jgi:outer membrane protein assembly factor BamB
LQGIVSGGGFIVFSIWGSLGQFLWSRIDNPPYLRVFGRTILRIGFFLSFALNLFGQSLLWKDRVDFTGGTDFARAAISVDKTTVVAGTAGVVGGGQDLAVRAYDKRTGTLQWVDRTPTVSGISTDVFLANAGGSVYFAGYKPGATPYTTDIFVRAYDLITGRVLWDNTLNKGRDDLPQTLDANSNAVVVAGYGGNNGTSSLDFIVRAYDPATGAVLWDDQVDKTGTDDAAWAVAIEGNQVFVAGTTAVGATNDLIVRAYEARSGKLKWETRRTGAFPLQIASTPGRLFVAGFSSSNAFVAALNAKTGTIVWQDTSKPGVFFDLAVKTNAVIAGGANNKRGILLRVYDPQTGAVMWQDQSSPQAGFAEFISAVTASDDAVYIAGVSGKDFDYSEFLVRGYTLPNGSVLFHERTQRGPSSSLADIAVAGNVLTVVGTASRDTSPPNGDWMIRSYRTAELLRQISLR